MLGPGSAGCSTCSITLPSGVAITKFSIRECLYNRHPASPGQNSHQHVNAENARDEHKGAGPRLTMPVVIGRNGIGKNLQGERCDRLTQAVVPKPVAESSEKERCRFAANARQRQQNASDDSL